MTNDQEYNGWTNYETWCVNLHISNDQGTWQRSQELTVDEWNRAESTEYLTRSQNARRALSDSLKDFAQEMAQVGAADNLFVTDLVTSALDSVNWREIADNYLNDHDDVDGYEEQ